MYRNQKMVSVSGMTALLLVLLNAIVLKQGMIQSSVWYGMLWLTVPALLIVLLSHRNRF